MGTNDWLGETARLRAKISSLENLLHACREQLAAAQQRSRGMEAQIDEANAVMQAMMDEHERMVALVKDQTASYDELRQTKLDQLYTQRVN